MSLYDELGSFALDVAGDVAENGGLDAVKNQLQALGLYTSSVASLFEENPELAVAGVILGTGIALGVGVVLAPEIETLATGVFALSGAQQTAFEAGSWSDCQLGNFGRNVGCFPVFWRPHWSELPPCKHANTAYQLEWHGD